jgi:Family of unknown function (DUF6912)
MTRLVFVPVDRADAMALRTGADLGVRTGCAPTAALADYLGPHTVAEEVEFAALSHAGVLALVAGSDPLRLVLAAVVADGQLSERSSELGEITVADLRWSQVQALFADEPAAGDAIAKARTQVSGLRLAEAVTAEAVAALQEKFDLLWFALEELDQLPS